jgi:hypothetical protein
MFVFMSFHLEKYLAIVDCFGLLVASDTVHINNVETITIGTTGIKPNTAVPPGVRDMISQLPTVP